MARHVIGPLEQGAKPPGWRVLIEGCQTQEGRMAWCMIPELAAGMTKAKAQDIADSLLAFLLRVRPGAGD